MRYADIAGKFGVGGDFDIVGESKGTCRLPKVIDLRSDIVTKPSVEMRRAMYEAEVGNDSWHEDPTSERLQELAADRLGKEAALFVTSGTQGNLLATLSHLGKGGTIVAAEDSHVGYGELDGYREIGSASLVSVPTTKGAPKSAELRKSLAGVEPGGASQTVVWVENTHNLAGGIVLTSGDMAATRSVAEDFGVPVHLDGSRIFNAATYLNVPASELAKDADSVQFCLSKGLGAPIGSILAGSAGLIEEARRWRQMIGGQMRQLGVVAAAGIVALEVMTRRLHEDHENARILAEGLAEIRGIQIDPEDVQTNLVFCNVERGFGTAESVTASLREESVLAGPAGVNPQAIRFAVHCDISRKDVADALVAISSVMENPS